MRVCWNLIKRGSESLMEKVFSSLRWMFTFYCNMIEWVLVVGWERVLCVDVSFIILLADLFWFSVLCKSRKKGLRIRLLRDIKLVDNKISGIVGCWQACCVDESWRARWLSPKGVFVGKIWRILEGFQAERDKLKVDEAREVLPALK